MPVHTEFKTLQKGLCLSGRDPQEFVPWWASEEGQLGLKCGRATAETPQIAGTRANEQAVVIVDMLWDLGQVHHLCVQGTKFSVFL